MDAAGLTSPDTEGSIKAKIRRRKETEKQVPIEQVLPQSVGEAEEVTEYMDDWLPPCYPAVPMGGALLLGDEMEVDISSELDRDKAVAEAMATKFNSRPRIGEIARSRSRIITSSRRNAASPFAHESQRSKAGSKEFRTPQSLRAPPPLIQSPTIKSGFVASFAKRHGMQDAFSPAKASATRRHRRIIISSPRGSFDGLDTNMDGVIDREEWESR